jgi:hypothetical protein
MQVVYFQGNNAPFYQYQHHLINSGLFQEEEVVKPTKDLDDIQYLNENSSNLVIWMYCLFFQSFREHILNLPKVPCYFPKFWKASIGGKSDMDALRQRIQKEKVMLYGVSRGSLVVARYCSQNSCENIKGIILEGGPFSISGVLDDHYGKWSGVAMKCLELFTSFKKSQESVDDGWVKNIPTHLPILIITSIDDEVVKYTHSLKMFHALKDTHDVKLVTLNNVKHNFYQNDLRFKVEVSQFIDRISKV